MQFFVDDLVVGSYAFISSLEMERLFPSFWKAAEMRASGETPNEMQASMGLGE